MRVLYLEDDPLDAEALRRALARLRPDVTLELCSTPSTALRRLRHAGERSPFDTIIVDVSLPEMSGFEFLDLVGAASHRAGAPRIVVFTSSEHRFDIQEAARTNADAYVVKTADPRCFDDLVAALDWSTVTPSTPQRTAASA